MKKNIFMPVILATVLGVASLSAEEIKVSGFVSRPAGGSFGIPKTGQTIKYKPGDDGYLTKGAPITGERFTNTPGTSNSVTDNGTGLVWVKNDAAIGYAGGHNFADAMTWLDALSAIAALNASGYDGSNQWRLPNINELSSIVDFSRKGPSLNTSFFSVNPSAGPYPRYWSSTTSGGEPGSYEAGFALIVSFYDGNNANVTQKTNLYYVRPVRDIQ